MPGMMKAARRRKSLPRSINEAELPTPFFNNDTMGTAWASTSDGDPVLMFMLGCDPKTTREYADELQGVTLRVVNHSSFVALDATRDGVSIGRLTTSLGSPLAAVIEQVRLNGGTSLKIGLVGLGEHTRPLSLPLVTLEGVAEDFEPVEAGTGGFVCFCMNVHTGVAYAHRFETEAQAREQRARNEAVDRPFVGLKPN